ncbi:hypothetical protein Pint_10782 [Pistacia integerrima]|uniref:Uncharacterized protein n=1 Tax=Pistacia integerrima TaxID=434235 RepID=A0ACC0XFF8_9ROSI|nr:hypothetical protein Pint_10782 [Pistacia integerrima]
MAEDLDELYASLSITEKENEAVMVTLNDLQDVLPYGEKCLLMRLFTKKYYNKEAFKGTMRKIWKTQPCGVWPRVDSFIERKNHGQSHPHGPVNVIHNNGERSGDAPSEEMVGEV